MPKFLNSMMRCFLAEYDNENDEYHTPVSPVDIWAEYARLKSLGWTQQRIAKAKGVSQQIRGRGWQLTPYKLAQPF